MPARNRNVDERFRVKPRPPRSRKGRSSSGFLARVIVEISHVGAGPRGRRGNHVISRGQAAAKFAGDRLSRQSRRVVVKTRLVRLAESSHGGVQTHLRYIGREGVTREGQPGGVYDAKHDDADVKAFEQRGRGDRHQFRFILAPEDALQLDDLHAFTRELMARMEVDLGSRLDWVAVDHWDTDNPHTHVVLRGKHQAGHDLVIAREYITHGMRFRASELATEWLGSRTELEILGSTAREVAQERWTSLDQALKERAVDGAVDLSLSATNPDREARRLRLIGRLQRLREMGLAQEVSAGHWQLRPGIEPTLRSLGERGDIIRTMQRAFADQQREYALFDGSGPITTVIGRVAAKGMNGELHDRPYLILDGLDARGHYVALPASAHLDDFPIGAIAEAGKLFERAADRSIESLAQGGLYRTEHHLNRLRTQGAARSDPEEIVAGHIRRLEALRRAHIVERVADGVWRVPQDMVERGRAYDRERLEQGAVVLRSHLSVERQIKALGATWLDQQLIENRLPRDAAGFARVVSEACEARQQFLVDRGFAHRQGKRVVLGQNLLETLRAHELNEVGARVAATTGLTYRAVHGEGHATGVYRRSLVLASGRFAMLDDGIGFSLVLWRPVIEKRLGQRMSVVVRGGNVSWNFGRQRGPGIGT